MKITKHVHSCMILEDQGKIVLIDPGKYGYEQYPPDFSAFKTIDFVLITHEHTDHIHLPFIRQILGQFPEVIIITNERVSEILGKDHIASTTRGNAYVRLSTKTHEHSIDPDVVPNTVFTVFDRFIHPGDNIEYAARADVMGLPIDCGLWGKVALAAEKLATLKPRYIVPLHDYRLKEEIKADVFRRLAAYYKAWGIEFLSLKPYDTVSVWCI